MTIALAHPDGSAEVAETGNGRRRINVTLSNRALHMPKSSWETAYPLAMIREILAIRGPAYLCDEIMREEDPLYVERSIRFEVLGYVSENELDGKLILDFGCGGGASSVVLARLLPDADILGIELDADVLRIARLRADHSRLSNARFLHSDLGCSLPEGVGEFDAIVMSAVYEHLLPAERKALLPDLWRHLRPGGFLFIFQTPYRFFPLESHTTRLPFINYLPDRLTHRIVGLASHRVGRGETWPDMLRRGIRGATDREILAILTRVPPPPILLEPSRLGLKNRIDLWVALSGSARLPALKRAAAFPLRCIRAATGHVCTPFISLALKKPQQ